MDDYLTAKQIEEFLQIDRISIYRMLRDGWLKGTKIGQQCRIPAKDIEVLFSGASRAIDHSATIIMTNFPTHCTQTIQNMFTEIAQVEWITVNRHGNSLFQSPIYRPEHNT